MSDDSSAVKQAKDLALYLEGLIKRVYRIESALTHAAEHFENYTKIHAAKKTKEGDAMAIANHRMAEECRNALNP